jgi:hypothetical protein
MVALGHQIPTTEEQFGRWASRLGLLEFEPTVQFIDPAESVLAPELAVRARLAILLGTYGDDYCTDSFDIGRLGRRVAARQEMIAFWGSQGDVRALRSWLRASADPDDESLAALCLGTATILNADREFSRGHWKLCRGGSLCRQVPSVAPALVSLLRFFRHGAESPDAHTIVSTVRNRRSQPGIPGGTAIQMLYTRELRASFWGFAPWHVMPGGALELLDYREIYRDPDAVRASASAAVPAVLADDDDRAFARTLIALNIGAHAADSLVAEPSVTRAAPRWLLQPYSSAELATFNPAMILPASREAGVPLDQLLADSPGADAACVVARVPLVDRTGAAQRSLRERGFHLTAVSPPKTLALPQAQPAGPFVGYWSRPRPGVPLVEPYYLRSTLLETTERHLATHLAGMVASWKEARCPLPA